jgi:hypothetical protein
MLFSMLGDLNTLASEPGESYFPPAVSIIRIFVIPCQESVRFERLWMHTLHKGKNVAPRKSLRAMGAIMSGPPDVMEV